MFVQKINNKYGDICTVNSMSGFCTISMSGVCTVNGMFQLGVCMINNMLSKYILFHSILLNGCVSQTV